MRQQRPNRRTPAAESARDRPSTVQQALALRAEAARRAAQSADRAERARAAAEYGAARHWLREYRQATTQCRLMGEHIRQQRADTLSSSPRRGASAAHQKPPASHQLRGDVDGPADREDFHAEGRL